MQIYSEIFNDWYNKGKDFLEKGLYKEAINCFNNAISHNPKSEKAWNKLAKTYEKLEKYINASDCYSKSLKFNKKSTKALFGIAINNLKRATKGSKGRSARIIDGKVLDIQKIEFKVARKFFDKVLKIDPGHELAWINKSITLINVGNYKGALNCIENALRINPNNEESWYVKGLIYFNQANYNKLFELIDDAINSNIVLLKLLRLKANVLLKLGRIDEAYEWFNHMIKTGEDTAKVYYTIGISLAMNNRAKEAVIYLDKALNDNPNFEDAKEAKILVLDMLGIEKASFHCPHCGSKQNIVSNFCLNCGKNLRDVKRV